MTYNFSLPMVDFGDESSLYWWANGFRSNNVPAPGYPPAYLVESSAVQIVLESVGRGGEAATVSVLRFLSVIVQLLNIVFVALIARRIGGNLAGIIAGLVWASLNIFLTYTAAVADPTACLFAIIALWFAVVANEDEKRRYWCVWSVAFGLISMLFKYPTVVSVVPGGLVAFSVLFKNRRQGITYLLWQGLLILATALFLVFGYGATQLAAPGAPMASSGKLLSNVGTYFRLPIIWTNIDLSLQPLNDIVFIVGLILAVALFFAARRFKWKTIHVVPFLYCMLFLILICWVTSIFTDEARTRDLFPAMSAACIILGVGFAQITNALTSQRGLVLRFGLVILLIGLVIVPQFMANAVTIRTRLRPDRRVISRQWTDASLDGGTVLVAPDDQSFNYHYSGIVGRSFDWWITNDVMSETPETWREKTGISYMSIRRNQVAKMEKSAVGQSYLAQLLHLRDFFAPPEMTGPEVAFYRVWRMQVETNIHFGDSISLVGYDYASQVVKPGDSIQFRLYWKASKQPLINYSMYVHLSSPTVHDLKAQLDGLPARDQRPTSTWGDPTENVISPLFTMTIPPDLPTGKYRLLIGLYDSATGQRQLTPQGEDYALLFPVDVVSEF